MLWGYGRLTYIFKRGVFVWYIIIQPQILYYMNQLFKMFINLGIAGLSAYVINFVFMQIYYLSILTPITGYNF